MTPLKEQTKEWYSQGAGLLFFLSVSFHEDLTMADEEQRRREEFLIEKYPFRRNAFLLINKMVELMSQAPGDVTALVDEILHSIFFLGKIHNPPFSPESILNDDQMLNELEDLFPRPFDLCSSQLPMRSPFSCVLDMVIHLTGRENEFEIIDGLRALISELDLSEDLVSSTICVSHRTDINGPVKYYGVSMSAPGRLPRKIMIAASCIGTWDRYVAGAVMTYFPSKKKDFDGTIQLPKRVRCQAFNLRKKEEKPPCGSCGNLFGLTPCENKEWVYGNCAEVESLSNLFKYVDDVKVRARPASRMYSDGVMLLLERHVKKELTNWLNHREFTWSNTFYTPQCL
ncbi:uncharacterized protein LOC117739278 [Cyclopterus lumpus]|uniref:uncharacterized protein LOC117739278 n=1 Tax=Cyclopterus lumpus TaxID=8103 RepID=UPI001486871B|nr:uncharacterized protein LOC117739278 [Cyclopterus lumpus]